MKYKEFNLSCWNDNYYIHKAIAGWLCAFSFIIGGIVGWLLSLI